MNGPAAVAGRPWEPVLAHLGHGAPGPGERAAALLPLLLGSAEHAPLPPARRSGLNPDGVPLQLCVSARPGGSRHVLIGDPCADVVDAGDRQRASVACARRLLHHCAAGSLEATLDATLDCLLPAEPAMQAAGRMGALWLAAGLDRPGFALYAGTAWEPEPAARWARVGRWLSTVLPRPRPAQGLIQALRDVARPESACIEGTGPDEARAKLYLRLARAEAPGALGALGLDDDRVHRFIADAVGLHTLPLAGLVASVSFGLAGGDPVDAKIDLCGHCLRRPAEEWVALLRRAERVLRVDAAAATAMLQAPGLELACIGIGVGRDRALRINTYARPVRPAGA